MCFRTFLIVIIFLLLPAGVHAATLSMVSTGGSGYVLQGSGFSGVSALEATIAYDPATLGAPQIVQGSLARGTLFAANPNIAGQLKVAFVHVSGVSGSGPVATIAFTPVGTVAGRIIRMTATLLDVQGKPLPVSIEVVNPVTDAAQSSVDSSTSVLTTANQVTSSAQVQTSGSSQPAAEASKTPVLGSALIPGTLTVSGDTGVVREPARRMTPDANPPPPPVMAEATSAPAPAAEAPPAKPREPLVLPPPPADVLERFRIYTGERTVAALAPLFTHKGGGWVVQTPSIARADGKTSLQVDITLERMGLDAPGFALRNLESKDVQTVGTTGWRLTVVPAAGSLQASITLLFPDATVEIPLTVVPPLPSAWSGKKLTEAAVNRFLAKRGTDQAPAGDLNHDGRRDYRDDYLMVGSYLTQKTPAKKSAPPPAAGPKVGMPMAEPARQAP